MARIILLLAVLPFCTACSEKQFASGLNNVWTSGAGNATGTPVFTAESGNQETAKKKKEPSGTNPAK